MAANTMRYDKLDDRLGRIRKDYDCLLMNIMLSQVRPTPNDRRGGGKCADLTSTSADRYFGEGPVPLAYSYSALAHGPLSSGRK
jgi:hypothetical protein